MLHKFLFFVVCLFMISCSEPDQVAIDEYYDMSGFWQSQIEKLQTSEISFTKVANLNGEENQLLNYKPDWTRELELFLTADLNKSAYKGAYEEKKSDNKITYTLKDGFEHPVQHLTVLFEANTPVDFNAKLKTENFLYNSNRTLEASFEDGILKNYHIKGKQSLFIGSEKEFDIRVEQE